MKGLDGKKLGSIGFIMAIESLVLAFCLSKTSFWFIPLITAGIGFGSVWLGFEIWFKQSQKELGEQGS